MQTLLLVIAVILALGLLAGARSSDWRTASREPVGLAPDPATTPQAVVQVYAARAVSWRGYFGVHSWVAVKPAGGQTYTVYEVIGWRLRYSDSALAIRHRGPDERWFGAVPELLVDRRGPAAEALIARIDRAAREYPYAAEYSVWPGPNSNTFTAWIARAVPELEIDLPPTAIGKDYLRDRIIATAPSGSGFQVSLGGLLGFTVSGVEGLEVNVLGLTFGFNLYRPALRLPMIGRLGPRTAASTQGAGTAP
ncbi:MAG TPA: DUF3750 domain-containing protein [Burkholderiales bacterium]|nr:DUF3750 domain-containing protein [Burkholderiales bacterium]